MASLGKPKCVNLESAVSTLRCQLGAIPFKSFDIAMWKEGLAGLVCLQNCTRLSSQIILYNACQQRLPWVLHQHTEKDPATCFSVSLLISFGTDTVTEMVPSLFHVANRELVIGMFIYVPQSNRTFDIEHVTHVTRKQTSRSFLLSYRRKDGRRLLENMIYEVKRLKC